VEHSPLKNQTPLTPFNLMQAMTLIEIANTLANNKLIMSCLLTFTMVTLLPKEEFRISVARLTGSKPIAL